MAQDVINIGTSPNAGDGEGIRDGGVKINNNFTEIYGVSGWANYDDGGTSPATQTFDTTPSKLQVDGLGSQSNSDYLPRQIRGISELWDTTNDKITPVNLGDAYTIRVVLSFTAKTGSPNIITLSLDIGGGATPTIIIASADAPAGKATPFTTTYSIPVFSLSTFLTNGGQIFINTDAGSVTASARSFYIKRDMNGLL